MTAPPPGLEHVPAHILPRLATMRPYTLVVLRKGPSYDAPDTRRLIQAEHLPYLFGLRDSGQVLLSTPAFGGDQYAAVALYNERDPAAVQRLVANDPAVRAGVFVADIVPVMGVPGDGLVP